MSLSWYAGPKCADCGGGTKLVGWAYRGEDADFPALPDLNNRRQPGQRCLCFLKELSEDGS